MPDEITSVIVVGSLHYDIVVEAPRQPERGETLMGRDWFPKFGGKGGNQAVAARKTGSDVCFLGAIGSDDFGSFLLARLEEVGVRTDEIEKCEGRSGMSVAVSDADGDYAAVVVSGSNWAIDIDKISHAVAWENGSVLILQNEVPPEVNMAAVEAARLHGLKVVWNAAPMRPDDTGLLALCDVVILNSVEARQMSGMEVETSEQALRAAEKIASLGTATVITLGGNGLVYCEVDGVAAYLPAQKIQNPKSHGAGDVFTGAFSTALAKGKHLADACSFASKAAYRHVSGQDLQG
nr:ribokinase [uncultured Cohaesibacter sp.]